MPTGTSTPRLRPPPPPMRKLPGPITMSQYREACEIAETNPAMKELIEQMAVYYFLVSEGKGSPPDGPRPRYLP